LGCLYLHYLKILEGVMNEKVLCIPAHMSYEDIERFVDVESLYISREEAETDDNYRQIIPYCIFFNNDSQRFLIYKRTKIGKETRLRDKYSIDDDEVPF